MGYSYNLENRESSRDKKVSKKQTAQNYNKYNSPESQNSNKRFIKTDVRAKKHLGQHFLNSEKIALDIASPLIGVSLPLIEVGPGMGVLTKYFSDKTDFTALDIDNESILYLKTHLKDFMGRIVYGDFLKENLITLVEGSTHRSILNDATSGNFKFNIIGNFPYNISSQIFFKIIDYRDNIDCCVGMLQKEVAERLSGSPSSKDYGILSVLLQAFYNVEYLFSVGSENFTPPPKVESGVIKITRNNRNLSNEEYLKFKRIVKIAFNQRRKMLGNALKTEIEFNESNPLFEKYKNQRAENLSVDDYLLLSDIAGTVQ